MNIRFFILCFFLLSFPGLYAGNGYCFRVYLSDKGETGYTLENPETYLSQEALERRRMRGVDISLSDLPISPAYIDTLVALGGEPIIHSKWFSTVVVATKDSVFADRVQELDIVDSVKWVWKGDPDVPYYGERVSMDRLEPRDIPLKNIYGYAEDQIKMLNGIRLHEAGFQGEGMKVAVLDGGFMNVDRISAFDLLRLIGTHNMVFPDKTVFEGDGHGTKVLACMAANLPGVMVGTAPDASYLLIKSEDGRTEYPIEEDYWAAAVEYADSVGVDVISSSLGYFHFDEEAMNYDPEDLDGKTSFISRAAQMAAEKGILIVISAGNEGNSPWGKITFPSDATDILTVGSITENKEKSTFSSVGFTADYRIKPDVVALGSGCTVIDASGNIRYGNGTSFSTPIVAGLSICLWQALPWLTNRELIYLLQQTSSQHKRPDAELGYGIPDMYKAYKEGVKHAKKHP
ncbi:MAG: S8 family serine peptidase [Tannerellaceae bacterium]|nr:S8 family serine peptidase [Tannerellaceae bacterium]